MNGILAQCIAIAHHGRSWLADAVGDPPEFTDGHSTFQYVSSVTFVGPEFDAVGVTPWLRHLAAAGVTELGLLLPDVSQPPADGAAPWHVRAAYSGGLPVSLYTSAADGGTAWLADWQADGGDVAKPWRVFYRAAPSEVELDRPPVAEAKDALVEALLAAAEFARTHRMEPWDMTFEAARVTGLSGNPEAAFHNDSLPADGVPLEKRQLWAMATGAEVFGGMGSWNDVSFDDPAAQRGYDAVSSTLYAAIMRAFQACVNTR